MSNQIVISSGAKVRNLDGVLTGSTGVVGSVPLGAANGVATLDSGGKVPVSQLPSSVVTYLGTWDAATNTPTLTNGTGDAGDMYICNVAGTVNFGAGPITFAVGDWVLYGSGTWQKSNGQNGTVTSVAVTESGDALSITGSPITTAGTINIGFAGTSGQYINGAGNLTTFPSLSGYLTAVTATAPLLSSGGTTPDISIPVATSSADGYLDSTDWSTFNNKQDAITLTTTGTSGAATLVGATLNIPNYSTDLSGYVPYTGATTNVNLGTHSLTAADLVINHTSGSGVAASITKGGNGEALTVVKSSGSGNAASITGGVTLLDELHLNTDLADAYIASAATWNAKQNAITLTTTGTSGAATFVGDTLNIPQYQGVLTNPVTGTGTTNTLPKFTAASTIGNSNITDSGSLITLGSNTNISSGGLGIGNSGLTNITLRLGKNITGSTTSYGIYNAGIVQSDVTTIVYNNYSLLSTSAASFSLTNYYHYGAAGGTIGAGSSIGTQIGFFATSGINGATNNYGFRGALASQANTWNLYMDGTANNYMAGSLGIGTSSLTGYNLRVSKNLTGATIGYGVMSDGQVQSDVTSTARYFQSVSNTAASVTAPIHHYRASQGTLSGTPSQQIAFYADAGLTGGSQNYGFVGSIGAGTNRWNIYIDGTANNYMAGSLGIGSTSLTGYSLRVSKNITGATTAFGIRSDGIIQSDVTANYFNNYSLPSTAAASFTLNNLHHYLIINTTIGAGSSITNQFGVTVGALSGATNNYGFYGDIASGANRWNLYMNGTASNYMAGSLGIGVTVPTTVLHIVGTSQILHRYTGSPNTFAFGQFNVSGDASINNQASANLLFATANTERMRLTSTGRLLIGSTTDSGEQLQVTGTAKITGAATFSSSVTASGNKPQLYVAGNASAGAGVILSTGLSGTDRRNWFIGTEENIAGDFTIKCSTAAGGNANSGDTRFAILNNGNVGIGTSSPNGKLTIDNPAGGNRASLAFDIYENYARIQAYGNGTSLGSIALNPLGNNVLIGTTTDSGQKLQVNGITKTVGLSLSGTTVSSTQTMTDAYYMWIFNGSSGQTLTLYSALGHNNTHFIKNSSPYSLTLAASNIETLTSTTTVASITIPAYNTVQVISNGGYVWIVMNQS